MKVIIFKTPKEIEVELKESSKKHLIEKIKYILSHNVDKYIYLSIEQYNLFVELVNEYTSSFDKSIEYSIKSCLQNAGWDIIEELCEYAVFGYDGKVYKISFKPKN